LIISDLIRYIWEIREKYGSTYHLWVGDRLAFFTTNPKDAEPVLSSQKHIEKNDLYNVLLPWLGNGLLLSSGKKWFNKRKIITPTFHFKILEQFVEVFNRKSDILVDKLAGRADLNEEFNIYAYITLFALDVISGIVGS
jgi:cytochrome P450 family 4